MQCYQRLERPLRPDEPLPRVSMPEVMQRIQEVISTATRPSWLRIVPRNFGEAAAGVLKADEWRMLSTVFLPIALISMWGAGTPHFTERQSRYLRQVLDHTMLVVAAISIAMMHTMTPTRSANFLKAMTTYLDELVDIHPHVHHLPNHHASMHLPRFFHLFGPS